MSRQILNSAGIASVCTLSSPLDDEVRGPKRCHYSLPVTVVTVLVATRLLAAQESPFHAPSGPVGHAVNPPTGAVHRYDETRTLDLLCGSVEVNARRNWRHIPRARTVKCNFPKAQTDT